MLQPKKKNTGSSTEKRTHTAKTKSGSTISIKKSTVDSAKAGTGAFKGRGSYKGKVHKNKSGKMSGITTHAGKYIKTTGPVARRKAQKALDYDKKKFQADSTATASRNKRIASAKKTRN